jgi:putative membrane protein
MKKLFSQIIAAIAGLWLAVLFVPEVTVRPYPDSAFFGIPLTAQWQIILVLGIILGLINYFVKPILKAISLPLEIITLGFFSLVINMALIWFLDLMFTELSAPLIWPLLYTTLIIWALNLLIQVFLIKDKD